MGQDLAKLFVDVELLPTNGFGFIQLLFLAATYAYVLTIGGTMIKDGSELLLLVPALAGMVGSIVLPVLGAVPDGAIVLFSGLGDDAQVQLNVGMGALAGSTIMLLTVPWALSMYAGRVDLDPDSSNGNYIKPRGAGKEWAKTSKGFFSTGVNVNDAIRHAAFAMILTMLSMFVIQVPACFARCSLTDQEADCKTPKWAALAAGVLCVVFFIWYLVDQYKRAAVDVVVEAKTLKVREIALARKIMTARVMFFDDAGGAITQNEHSGLLASHTSPKFEGFIRRMFTKYDRDRTGFIDKFELVALLDDLGEKTDAESVDRFMKEVDTNQDGSIDFKEFFAAMQNAAKKQQEEAATDADDQSGHRMGRPSSGFGTQVVSGDANNKENKNNKGADQQQQASSAAAVRRPSDAEGDDDAVDAGAEEEEEEDAEMPEDLADLPPDVQRRRVLVRSCIQMSIGTAIVLLFSDPMVDVLNELGTRTHIKPFYVAFILAPLVSNGSELIAAYAYAGKKTVSSATIAFSTLLGAASMNNTFCMAIFLFLVAFKDLKWVFTAEVAAMIFAELLMFGMIIMNGLKYKSGWMLFVISILPLSLALVAGLEAGGLD